MRHEIPVHKFFYNIVVAILLTAILALPVAVFANGVVVGSVSALRYQQTSFAYFEAIFITEEPTTKRLGGDFSLHPILFEKVGDVYSAEFNGTVVQFEAGVPDHVEEPCDATINGRSIGCERISYFDGQWGGQKFIRLTGDIGLSSDQAVALNAPHWEFDNLRDRIHAVASYLIPCVIFFLICWIIRWHYRSRVIGSQFFGLIIPWAAGLAFWTFWLKVFGG